MTSFDIPLNKPYTPGIRELTPYLEGIEQRRWITNFGPLEQELQRRLSEYLGVEHLLLVSNGTVAIQVAIKALNVHGAILTTPFTFVATSAAAAWMGHTTCFCDVDASNFNMDPEKAQGQVNRHSVGAILPVHTFGTACDVESLARVALEAQCPLIYDAAHAFGVRYKGRSLLQWGDASTLSLHATKVFHSGEGGAIVFRSSDALERARSLINFGINPQNGDIEDIGINAKMSEYHAAVGLCVLDRIDDILLQRTENEALYRRLLDGVVELQEQPKEQCGNGAYMSILLHGEEQVLAMQEHLAAQGILSRRYFYPSLNSLAIFGKQNVAMPNAVAISKSILCLPLFYGMSSQEVKRVCSAVKVGLRNSVRNLGINHSI